MNITKDTTDDELRAPVRRAKVSLMEKLQAGVDTMGSDDLATEANNVAAHEGILEARYELRNALSHDATPDQIRDHMISVGLRSLDDTYSGRRNDVRRAKADARRQEVADLLSQLKRKGTI